MMVVTMSAALVVAICLVAILVVVPGHFGMRILLTRTILSPTGQA